LDGFGRVEIASISDLTQGGGVEAQGQRNHHNHKKQHEIDRHHGKDTNSGGNDSNQETRYNSCTVCRVERVGRQSQLVSKTNQIKSKQSSVRQTGLLGYDTGNGQQDRARGCCWFKAGAVGDLMTPLAFNFGHCKGHKQNKRTPDIGISGKK